MNSVLAELNLDLTSEVPSAPGNVPGAKVAAAKAGPVAMGADGEAAPGLSEEDKELQARLDNLRKP